MSSSPSFPFTRFSSLLGVHTALLGFVALYLPRSSLLLFPLPDQASSRDRPQHPFIQPLTADPLLTLVWLCFGVAITQASYSTWLKIETERARAELLGNDEEAKLKVRMRATGEKLQVSRVNLKSFAE